MCKAGALLLATPKAEPTENGGKDIVRLRIGSYNAITINDNWHFYLLHSIK